MKTTPYTGIVPPTLVRRLDEVAGWEPPDSPRAAVIKEAADTLRNMPVRLSDGQRLEDENFQAVGYRIETHGPTKEMRLVFFGQSEQRDVLAHMLFASHEAYDMAQYILKNYDKLEGVE